MIDIITYTMDIDISMIDICLAQYAQEQHDLNKLYLNKHNAKIFIEHTQA